MRVEVLYFEGCPHQEALLSRVRAMLSRIGAEADVELRRVESPEDAERERFLGSPTLRVDGEDVDTAAAERTDYGVKCRLYTTPAGLSGAPPDEWIFAALARAGHPR